MSIAAAQEIVTRRGSALTDQDVRQIRLLLAEVPLDEYHQAAPWIWEAVAQIVNDPDYAGDVTPADLKE